MLDLTAYEMVSLIEQELQQSFDIKLAINLWQTSDNHYYYDIDVMYDDIKPPLRYTLIDDLSFDLSTFAQALIMITKDLINNGAKYECKIMR